MYEIRELSGQEYVDEYATKKRSATATTGTTDATATEKLSPAAEEATSASSSNGHGEGHATVTPIDRGAAARAAADAAADPVLDDSAFVEATEARSSADVLRAPIRRSVG
jgi:hypothetical protein